ncbi:Hypothetical predicted protein [Paramuricea clavata]|uniref:Uncharacterized protein n=1 Tax=Paramuricea clavata TaxID=317549 RepID=A0A7D9HFU6_PARCT|nr:Hypothetical predicted protein [Paramuricea clavata]
MMKIFVLLVAVLLGLVCSRSVPDSYKRLDGAPTKANGTSSTTCKGYHIECTTSAECCHQYHCSSPYSNSTLMCIETPPVLGCIAGYEICQSGVDECCDVDLLDYECTEDCRPEGPNCSKEDESACEDFTFFTDCPRKCGKCDHRCVEKNWGVIV